MIYFFNAYAKMPTVKELRAQAKAHGYKGYSRMRKAELETLLNKQKSRPKSRGSSKEYPPPPKRCPAGSSVNPATKRCRKDCKPGYVRHDGEGRCKWGYTRQKASTSNGCTEILRKQNVSSNRDFKFWAKRGGHPDKGGDNATFQNISDCVDKHYK